MYSVLQSQILGISLCIILLTKTISVSEALLESIPQTHILFVLAVREPSLIQGNDDLTTILFWATFTSSLFSASFAMANFLKRGPCRLVKDQGCLGGFMERGFVYLFINIVATIMMKGLNLAFSLNVLGYLPENVIYWRPAYWFLLHVIPQFFYVSWNELISISTPPIAEILCVKNGRAIVVCGFLLK